jgi:uncharacterized protein (DUF3820 family)|tara:strand:+ start:1058 stop:1324 length:267 start_codon:yes stop_codon:yes gene_type:complete
MACCENISVKLSKQKFKNGVIHIRKDCEGCNKFLGYAPQELQIDTAKIHFGKYKDKLVKEVPRDYLTWLTNQTWVKQNLKDLCNKILL